MARGKIIDDYLKKHAPGLIIGAILFLVWWSTPPDSWAVFIVWVVIGFAYGFIIYPRVAKYLPWPSLSVFLGMFLLAWRILQAVWYLPVTIYKLLAFRKPPQP